MNLTEHACVRAQQRGLSGEDLRLLIAWGEESHDGHGAMVRTLTPRAIERIRREAGRAEAHRAAGIRGAYCVEALDNGAILTCGWITGRRRRG